MENKICVYAICKNEAQFVKRWYDSMKEADYIVVLDTGSTDGTQEELLKCDKIQALETKIEPWRFDLPRNLALEHCPEDANILVSTDLDEILEPGWAKILREKWDDSKHERCIYKYTWSHLDNGADGRIFQYDKIHSRNWIWKYPVHELLVNTKTGSNKFSMDNTLVLFNEIHLHHYPDKNKSRSDYLPLLELRKEENEDDYYGRIYLAHEYYYRNFYKKSINELKDILKVHDDKMNSVERASCYLFMGDCYKSLNDNREAAMCYRDSINADETYREPYLNLGILYLMDKRYDDAINIVKQGLKKSYRHYTWLERDRSWSYEPYDILSLACFYGGYKKDSLAYAVKALSYDQEDERLKNNITLILNNMKDSDFL